MLKRIRIQNYKCFEDFDCSFGETQLLIGDNGSGKSTVFEVLETLRDVVARGEPLLRLARVGDPEEWRLGGETFTRWQNSEAIQTLEVEVELSGRSYVYRLVVGADDPGVRHSILEERLRRNDDKVFEFANGVSSFVSRHVPVSRVYGAGHRPDYSVLSANLAEEVDDSADFVAWLRNVSVVRVDPRSMSGIAGRDAKQPEADLSNFAEWYRHLRLTSDDREYLRELAEVLAGFETIRLDEAGERRHELKFKFSPGTNGSTGQKQREYLMSELSPGQRVIIGLYAILHFAVKPGATVCFDEPDNFISLREVMPWLQRTLEVAEENDPPSQVLIASHHPELLNWMAFKEGLLFERPDGGAAKVRRFGDTLKTGLSASELVVRGWDDV